MALMEIIGNEVLFAVVVFNVQVGESKKEKKGDRGEVSKVVG